MSAQSQHLKKYFAEILVPVANVMKEVDAVLDEKVDMAFGHGLLTFDDACKIMEQMVINDEDAFGKAYACVKVCPQTLTDSKKSIIIQRW
jgi:hypothetical protein